MVIARVLGGREVMRKWSVVEARDESGEGYRGGRVHHLTYY